MSFPDPQLMRAMSRPLLKTRIVRLVRSGVPSKYFPIVTKKFSKPLAPVPPEEVKWKLITFWDPPRNQKFCLTLPPLVTSQYIETFVTFSAAEMTAGLASVVGGSVMATT